MLSSAHALTSPLPFQRREHIQEGRGGCLRAPAHCHHGQCDLHLPGENIRAREPAGADGESALVR